LEKVVIIVNNGRLLFQVSQNLSVGEWYSWLIRRHQQLFNSLRLFILFPC